MYSILHATPTSGIPPQLARPDRTHHYTVILLAYRRRADTGLRIEYVLLTAKRNNTRFFLFCFFFNLFVNHIIRVYISICIERMQLLRFRSP